MRTRVLILALAALGALAVATAASGELAQKGNLRISFNGSFTPKALPRDRPAPVTVEVEGNVGTTDGSRPPVLERVEIGLNRNGLLDTQGLPSCRASQLQATTTAAALSRCRPALVGHGSFRGRIDGQDVALAGGKILAFNGRAGGRPALLLQLYSQAPVRIAFVIPLKIAQQAEAKFGTVLTADIPVLASGAATVTDIKLKIGRTYSYRGERHSFLSASCAAPAGFTAAIFAFARGSFHFSDGKTISAAIVRDCRVRRVP
jgi:hypothetical protein